MKVLLLTAMWPTSQKPAYGTFVRAQAEALKAAGAAVQVLVLEAHPQALAYLKGPMALKRAASSGFDVVHAHYSYVGAVARTQWKIPVVVTYHGDDVLGTVGSNGRTTKLSRAAAFAGRLLGHFVDAVIVQSQEMATRFSSSNVHVIPHEVDLDLFQGMEQDHARAALGLSPDRKYLLFAANPAIPVKRYALARAAADIVRAHDPTVELLTVFKEPQVRLALYMNACDALVFPSYQEGSPNIIKQAMACNLPIVSTRVGDVEEIIGETEGCFISAPVVQDFVVNVQKALQFGNRTQGRQQVEHLAGPLVARRLINLYEKVSHGRQEFRASKLAM